MPRKESNLPAPSEMLVGLAELSQPCSCNAAALADRREMDAAEALFE